MLALIDLAAVSAGTVPTLDISASCRPQIASQDQIIDYKSCVNDEQATKQRLIKEWSSYSVAARSLCAGDRGSLANSYVELLACIEMQTWKNSAGVLTPSGGALGGAKGGSPPPPGEMGSSLATHSLGGRPGAHIP
jgi:hypothetical protein